MRKNPMLPRIHGARRLLPATALFASIALASPAPVHAENVLTVHYAEGASGDVSVPVIVTAQNDVALHGYSVAVSFPKDALQVTSFDVDGTHAGSDEPEFVGTRIDNELGIASLAVIVNFGETSEPRFIASTLPDQADRIVARLSVDVRDEASGGFHRIRLSDGVGQPPAYNRFTNAGTSIVPRLIDGRFFVRGRNVLALDKKFAFFGSQGQIEVFAYAQHTDALAGYQITYNFDCSKLTLLGADYAATDVDALLGRRGKVEFFQTDIDDTIGEGRCRSRTGVIFDYLEPIDPTQVLPASPNEVYAQTIARFVLVQETGIARTSEALDLVLDTRPGELNNAFLVDTRSLDPHLIHGKLYFSTGSASGRVVDRMTAEPIGGCRVVLDPDGLEATTSADGSFRIDDVLPGTYAVRLIRAGHYLARFDDLVVTGNGEVADWGTLTMYKRPATAGLVLRGTANGDARVDISDAIWILNWLFTSGPAPSCLQAADSNADNRNDISDSIFLLNYLFSGGDSPAAPFPDCGPIDSRLSCETPPPCNG